MASDDADSVVYDRSGVPLPEERDGNYYGVKISPYFYNRMNRIDVDSDFSLNDISSYNLSVSNNQVDISTSKKLINYLKSLLRVNVNKLDSKIDNKLDKTSYVVDTSLKTNSNNPVRNSVVANKVNALQSAIDTKSDILHTHTMSQVSSLNATINGINTEIGKKANDTDLTNHINNKKNPHEVTLKQLGIDDTGWVKLTYAKSGFTSVFEDNPPEIRRVGDVVQVRHSVKTTKTFNISSWTDYMPICKLPVEFRPSTSYTTVTQCSYNHNSALVFNLNEDGYISAGRFSGTTDSHGAYTVPKDFMIGLYATYLVN